MADDPKDTKPAAPAKAVPVKMTRDPKNYPAPHTAEVHPDEVGNFAVGGWVKV